MSILTPQEIAKEVLKAMMRNLVFHTSCGPTLLTSGSYQMIALLNEARNSYVEQLVALRNKPL